MSAQHTPGPWMAAAKPSSIVGWPVVSKEGRSIASVSHLATPGTPFDNKQAQAEAVYRAECEANARLIAAAPELLEALLKLRHNMRRSITGVESRKAWDKANAAIYKATGEAA